MESYFQIFLSSTRTFFSLIILKKSVILLHSHCHGELKLYINLPRIIGLVTAVRDARNAVMGSTVSQESSTDDEITLPGSKSVLCVDALIQCTEIKPEMSVWIYAYTAASRIWLFLNTTSV